jgi:nucleoside-diphosphate-sugar epimerase
MGQSSSGRRVIVIGAASAVGRQVVARLRADERVDQVVAVDEVAPLIVGDAVVEVHRAALADPELKALVADAATIIYVGSGGDELGPDGLPVSDPAGVRALLDAAAAAQVSQLVVVSSAMVYGASSSNPLPLTEEAPLRPDPGFTYGAERAEVERLVSEWRVEHPEASVAILRPAVSVNAELEGWLALSPWSARALRTSGADRASQFLHVDDLASAVDHARRSRLDGPYNVAPDGWLSADALAELAGPVGRVHLPAGWTPRLRAARDRWRADGPPPETAYTRFPWVVANDRLRATGWEPSLTNEEVYVEADPGGPLAAMSPRRRQELSLAGAGFVLAALAGGVVWLVRRRSRSTLD